jgi:biotin carboxyl carrier protein
MSTNYSTYVDGEELELTIHQDGSVELDGECFHVNLEHIANNVIYSMLIEGRSYEVFATFEDGTWRILVDGERHEVEVEDERTKRLKGLAGPDKKLVGDIQIKAPMPGLVVKVPIEVGQTVEANQPLVILEAMKMENELRAPRAGIIKDIRIKPQQTVQLQEILLILGTVEEEG